MADEFELIISLGGLCQVAYQIEQRFGFRISSPFDWIVTPLESVAKILSDDGLRFGSAIHVDDGGRLAVCSNYGVAYHHDHAKDENYIVHVSAESMIASRSKMIHKYKKLAALLEQNQRTLFVRLGGHHDCARPEPYRADPRPTTTDDLNALCGALSARFPNLPFQLAFVTFRGVTPLHILQERLDPRVRLFEIKDYDTNDWAGYTSALAPIFDEFSFMKRENTEVARQFVGERINDEQFF
jgi:hypothetical protein